MPAKHVRTSSYSAKHLLWQVAICCLSLPRSTFLGVGKPTLVSHSSVFMSSQTTCPRSGWPPGLKQGEGRTASSERCWKHCALENRKVPVVYLMVFLKKKKCLQWKREAAIASVARLSVLKSRRILASPPISFCWIFVNPRFDDTVFVCILS